ncbi:L-type lectin-domain containing protein [Levilactobacillus sp. HBUAS70063]|uniref:L-type lectin-domain containing protein n=1 Tax=Levilactobacillus sp. HBUAS70063 TaxID=3109359 RepID=UPI003132BF4B
MKRIGQALLLLGLAWVGWGQPAQARADTGDVDLAHAIATAPRGIPLSREFAVDIPGSATKLLDSPTVPQSIAQITPDAPNQVGAVWSRMGSGGQQNQFDLTQDMEMGFWLYFGNKQASAGEGLAFVVQNSPQGDHALASGGQSLGVWGRATTVKEGHAAEIAQTAIQNSWALEFDTHVNAEITDVAGYFDGAEATKKTPHIAYASPADPSYYKWTPELINSSWQAGYLLRHYHANPLNHAADGNWHHFSLFWQPTTRRLTYYYDDRDPATNQAREIFDSDVFDVNPEDLANGVTDPTKAYWGITGATGPTNSANQLVMVDHASSLGKVTTAVHLDDETTHSEVQADTTVAAGDRLTYRYEFDYQPTVDEQALAPLTMTMPVPEGLEVSGGRVTYDDQTADQIAKPTGKTIRVTWSRGLTKRRHHATVTVTGHALPAKQTVTRPSVTAAFYGDNYQASLTSSTYQVKGGLYLRLTNLGDEVVVVKRHETATVNVRLQNGEFSLSPAEIAQYPLQIHLNQRDYQLADFAGQQAANGDYRLHIPGKLLAAGENTLAVQAKNAQHQSNVLNISLVRSPGTLSFERIPAQASFESYSLTGQHLLLHRNNDWQLAVRDERGTHQRWRLEVALRGAFETATGRQLSGQPLLVGPHGQAPIDAKGATVVDKVSQSDDEVTAVDREWTTNTGILLDVAADALAGDYQGTLQWSLVNAE